MYKKTHVVFSTQTTQRIQYKVKSISLEDQVEQKQIIECIRMTYLANHICSVGYRVLKMRFYTILQGTRPSDVSDDHLAHSTDHLDDCTDNPDDFDVSHYLRGPKLLNQRPERPVRNASDYSTNNPNDFITRNATDNRNGLLTRSCGM